MKWLLLFTLLFLPACTPLTKEDYELARKQQEYLHQREMWLINKCYEVGGTPVYSHWDGTFSQCQKWK